MNAYLIICHKNPYQVIRLLEAIKSEKADIFIHVDKLMSDIDYKTILEYISKHNHIYLTEKRWHGELDKRVLVDITLELIKNAKVKENTKKKYKYFILLSGQCYPIKPIKYIENELEKIYPKPIIDCTPYDTNNWIYHKFNVNRVIIFFRGWGDKNIKRKFYKILFKSFVKILQLFFITLRITSKNFMDKEKKEIYGGSAWWILPDDIIEFILKEYTEINNRYVNILLNDVWTPEEIFFQTVVMNGLFKKQIELNPKEMISQNCKTWAYFFDENKSFNGHPHIFTKEEFTKLVNNNFWFARKFDINVDSKILDMIDEKILKKKEVVEK